MVLFPLLPRPKKICAFGLLLHETPPSFGGGVSVSLTIGMLVMSIAMSEENKEFSTAYNCLDIAVDLPVTSFANIVQRELTLVINPQYRSSPKSYPYPFNSSPYAYLRFPNSQVKMCAPDATLADGFTAPKRTDVMASLVDIDKDGRRYRPNTVTITLMQINVVRARSGEFNIRAVREITNNTIWSIGCWHYTPSTDQHVMPNPSLKQKHINHS